MAYINIPIKDNTTPLTPTEFNYLVDKLNARRLRDLIDVQDTDAADKNIIRHNGSGWVYYNIETDFYTKTEIDEGLGGSLGNVNIAPAWGEITGVIRDQLDLVANFGDLKALQNTWDGEHYAENYILTGSGSSNTNTNYWNVTDGVNTVQIGDEQTLTIQGTGVTFDFATKTFNITGGGGGSSTFDDLTDTPASKTTHSLKVVRVNVGETALEYVDLDTLYSVIGHSHLWADITDKPTTFTPSAHTHLWADITDKPTTFAPSSHTHLWADITDKPTTFAPSGHTLESHSDVTLTLNSAGEILKWNGTAWINNTLAEAGISGTSHNHSGVYEPVFTKNTAFNKNFGTTVGTVAQGNDSRILNGQTAFGWGNHASVGYLTSLGTALVDADFPANGLMRRTAAGTYSTITDNSANWTTAFNWGNHATEGYLTSSDPVLLDADFGSNGIMIRTAAGVYGITANNTIAWDNAVNWGDHSLEGYLNTTSGDLRYALIGHNHSGVYAPVSHTHVIANITDFTDNSTNWNTAFGWGNHALGGYAAASHTHTFLTPTDDRDYKPNTSNTYGSIRAYFTSLEGMTGAVGGDYQDMLLFNTYLDASGGDMNAITLDKSDGTMRLWNADQAASTWGTPQIVLTNTNVVTELTTLNNFLRSDIADEKTAGDLTFASSVKINLASAGDLWADGTNTYLRMKTGNLLIDDAGVATRFTFGRTTGNFTATGLGTFEGLISNDFLKADKSDITAYSTTLATATSEQAYDQFRVLNTDATVGTGFVSMYMKHIGSGGNAVGRFILGNSLSADGFFAWQLRDSAHTGDTREKMRLTSDGNLGIGTTSPSTKLSLAGVGSDTTLGLSISNTDGADIHFRKKSGFTNALEIVNANNDIDFQAGGSSRIFIESTNGNVGIGTTSPSAKFQVVGGTDAWSGIVLKDGGTNIGQVEFRVSDNGTRARISNGFVNDAGGDSLDFGVFSLGAVNNIMTLRGSGNVGIGTTSPSYKLDIAGTGRFTDSLRLDNSSPQLQFYNSATNYGRILGTASGLVLYSADTSFGIRIYDAANYFNGIALFKNAADTAELMRLHDNGNLTIGTSTDSGDRIYASGTIKSTSFMYAPDFKIFSDKKLKTNIKDLEVKPIDVRWREFEFKNNLGDKRLGVIAQELEVNHPEFVTESADGTKTVSYTDLLVAKMAEKDAQIESLEARIDRLERMINNLIPNMN